MVERLTAVKCRVVDLHGTFVEKTGTEPSYVDAPSGKIARANLIATVVSKPGPNAIVIDDSTGTIECRAFDRDSLFNDFVVGSIVLIVGRPRRYQENTYLVAEIAKKLGSQKWLELRKRELSHLPDAKLAEKTVRESAAATQAMKPQVKAATDEAKAVLSKADEIIKIVRELDSGTGAAIEEIIAKAGNPAEKVLGDLMAEGEIFEIRPGRVKVLE